MSGYTQDDIDALRHSGLFDEQWYLEEYPDVEALGMDPVEHYLWVGRSLGRRMSPKADKFATHDADLAERDSVCAAAGKTFRSLTVIIPIYNAPDETQGCIDSVLCHTPEGIQVILIDDASPDPRIGQVLERYAAHPSVQIYRNNRNMGFSHTVNMGIEAAGRTDVVLLNSDTKVTPFWLRNLRRAAYSGKRVATATPFSDNAGAFSAPLPDVLNPLPQNLDLDTCARLVTRGSQRLYPSVPTGHGFCLYLRRDAIDAIGTFDAEAFPRGYGEENDFCMRAGRAGWVHVIDDATLVHHVRSASFGSEKAALMATGRAVVDRRYPEYEAAIRAFYADPVVAKARQNFAASLVQSAAEKVRPRILYVISTLTGGTPQTNEDLMRALADRIETFVLRCDSRTVTLLEFRNGSYEELERRVLAKPIYAFPHRSADYDVIVRDWLLRYAIELVHIRHIGWHSLGLIDEAENLEIPVAFSFHDFYTVCPNVKLLDENLVHCAGHCTASQGQCRMELWNAADYPPLKHGAVYKWRAQMRSALEKCDLFFTTSETTKALVTDVFPFLKERRFEVIPHGRDFPRFEPPAPPPEPGEKLRLLVAGHIAPAKGAHIIAELAARADELDLEIHLLGDFTADVTRPPSVIVHGPYKREEFLDRIRVIRPHVAGVFSIWPETWCHTLTEFWAAGLPVIGFPLGAVGKRLRTTGAGWVCEEMTADAVFNILKKEFRSESRKYKPTISLNFQYNILKTEYKSIEMANMYFKSYEIS